MNVPFLFASRVERIGWLLIHSLWQFALVALVVVVLLRILRRSSAAVRYGVCLTGLLAVAIAPAVTWTLLPTTAPPLSDAADNDPFAAGDIAAHRDEVGDAPSNTMPGTVASTLGAGSPSSAAPVVSPSVEVVATPMVASWSMQIRRHVSPWLGELVTVWCLGVLLFALRPLGSWYLVHRLRSVGVSPVSQPVLAAFDRAMQRIGVQRPVRVLGSSLARVPMVVGYVRPVILLPLRVVTGLSSYEVEAILAHELAHIRRHDYAVNLLQILIETVCFYHPAVWWLSSRLRHERECCCDELAVRAIGNRQAYGRAMLTLEELRGSPTVLSLSATHGSLLERIRRLAGEQSPPTAGLGLTGSLLLCALLAGGGLWRVSQAQDSKPVEAAQIRADEAGPISADEAKTILQTVLDAQLKREAKWKDGVMHASITQTGVNAMSAELDLAWSGDNLFVDLQQHRQLSLSSAGELHEEDVPPYRKNMSGNEEWEYYPTLRFVQGWGGSKRRGIPRDINVTPAGAWGTVPFTAPVRLSDSMTRSLARGELSGQRLESGLVQVISGATVYVVDPEHDARIVRIENDLRERSEEAQRIADPHTFVATYDWAVDQHGVPYCRTYRAEYFSEDDLRQPVLIREVRVTEYTSQVDEEWKRFDLESLQVPKGTMVKYRTDETQSWRYGER
jgi:beta-lactamase regulating signal transducer with metallopeptidase domain